MHEFHPHTRRHLLAIVGVALASTAALSAPVSAVIDVNATIVATSGCEADGQFHLHTTLGNTGAFGSAHFVVTAVDVYGPITIDLGVDVSANTTRDDDWRFFEGVPGSVHITSTDAVQAIDFLFEVTPDCVPDETVPVDSVPVDSVPVDTAVDSGAGGVPSAGGLPSTGSSNAPMAAVALALLAAGVGLVRVVRRPA